MVIMVFILEVTILVFKVTGLYFFRQNLIFCIDMICLCMLTLSHSYQIMSKIVFMWTYYESAALLVTCMIILREAVLIMSNLTQILFCFYIFFMESRKNNNFSVLIRPYILHTD